MGPHSYWLRRSGMEHSQRRRRRRDSVTRRRRVRLGSRGGDKAYAAEREASIKIPEAQDAIQGVEGVLEADLLALLVGAARVADRDLVDAPRRLAAPRDLGGDLRLEAEAVRLEVDVRQHLAPEDLVAGLHV